MNKTQNDDSNFYLTDEDWFYLGKADAWAEKPKNPPEQDPQAASLYDLGYSEGAIERSPTVWN
ncbi:hypothetical protein HC931_12545 [Candidatus Gracilibacteria bacterium]|jgi:hypothetical protein|nr:hypothetical protein [Candidatus Gracilibacteria bacterium]NJM87477.1 hypothetical protein [Hydrococcus sp. RU_2_2]NJP19558.1 hypothetical protein [Hydrococcus sp. CRU_1_1]NJQ98176.1 hypothetical protein [Hydrococcus sp. CSU_1_8]